MGPRVLVLAIALCIAVAGAARAEDKPWAAGVSKDRQTAALKIYREGNALFERDLYPEALEHYRRALADWDHPAIHYNAAVCLIRLDRVLEAYAHLERALRFGEAPLGGELFREAQGYHKLLVRQVGELEVAVDEPGAQVTLDGKPLFVGPGRETTRVLVGAHQLVVTKDGYVTETRPVTLAPAGRAQVTIDLRRREAPRRLTRRWAAWKPYAVIGGGALVAGALGAPLFFAARDSFDEFDAAVAGSPPGTPWTDEAQDHYDRARLQRALTYGAFAVGGAVIVTGVVMVFANQPRFDGPAIVPQVGADRVGLVISGRL